MNEHNKNCPICKVWKKIKEPKEAELIDIILKGMKELDAEILETYRKEPENQVSKK